MNVSSVSGISNNYNASNINKVNNGPSFGALSSKAADVFIQAAKADLDQKGVNEVLEQLIKFAERAKQSLILDVDAEKTENGFKLLFSDVIHNAMSNIPAGHIEKIKAVPMENWSTGVEVKLQDGFDCNETLVDNLISNKGFKEGDIQDSLRTTIKNYMQYLTGLFDKKEAEIIDQIETDKITDSLMDKLQNLVTVEPEKCTPEELAEIFKKEI